LIHPIGLPRVFYNWLVVEPTPLKNISQNGNLLQVVGENEKYLKPPPRQGLSGFYMVRLDDMVAFSH